MPLTAIAIKNARSRDKAYKGHDERAFDLLVTPYIEANFRETQLARVRVGQQVGVTADALPGVRLKGRVESLSPSSGASFFPVPPHNATGNFTKIVQRLPVRIRLDKDQADVARLRVGMSVTPVMRTRQERS